MNTKTLHKCVIVLLSLNFFSSYAQPHPHDHGPQHRPHPQHVVEHAVVNASAIYMRQAPDYESALETQELMGREVTILERKGYWCRIACDQPYEAWTTYMNLVVYDFQGMQWWRDQPKLIVTGMTGTLKEFPSQSASNVGDVVFGDILARGPYASKNGFASVLKPDGTRAWIQQTMVMDMQMWQYGVDHMAASHKITDILNFALSLKGVPYLWGGMTPKGVDCSGLVRIAYMCAGVVLPRNASQMAQLGRWVEIPGCQACTVPSREPGDFDLSQLCKGDLLFFGKLRDDNSMVVTHVALYLGDNHIIHASHLVRVNSLMKGDSDYYENSHKLLGACRIIE